MDLAANVAVINGAGALERDVLVSATMTALSDERVAALYEQFRGTTLPEDYAKWRVGFVEAVRHFASLSDEQLKSPSEQERLWRARGISGIGPGDSVNVTGAYTDGEIADALVAVRSRTWPADVAARAQALQAHFDETLALVVERHATRRPQAKLARAFTALIPGELDTCFSWPARQAAAELMLGRRGLGFIEGGVLVAERMHRVLGRTQDATEIVSRAQFLWWLTENKTDALAGSEVQPPAEVVELPPITPWPPTKQFRGIPAVTGYHEAFRATLRAAQNGATDADIVFTLQQDTEGRSEKSLRSLFNLVRRMGFLSERGGLWFPSEDGEDLLASDPPDILVSKVLVQTFGIGHILQFLEAATKAKREIFDHLMALYPNWSTPFMPSALVAWADSLGLLEDAGGTSRRLSDYGRAWLGRLPRHLAVPPREEEELLVASPEQTEEPRVAVGALLERFGSDLLTKELVFDELQLRTLHAAWSFHSHKRFVLLSGLSGTGKTRLLSEYARLYCDALGVDVRRHREIVAVSPSWRDPTGLLGYFNPLHSEPTFQPEPALRLTIEAARNPSSPYFLILDEMNLARVEQYFAPFLSAMETGADLVLHAQGEPVNGVPPTVRWPRNLFIGGTVNMDETTHPFSDKVLDRAFTLEFWDVDLGAFLERRHQRGKRQELPEAVLLRAAKALAGVRRHFGYRTAEEYLDFVAAATQGANEALQRSIVDRALFSKILPRIRGEDSPSMREALSQLAAVCADYALPDCARKVQEMDARLASTGLTRFWA